MDGLPALPQVGALPNWLILCAILAPILPSIVNAVLDHLKVQRTVEKALDNSSKADPKHIDVTVEPPKEGQ